MQLTDFTIHQIEFTLKADTDLHLGVQAGAQFRGALWSHLQRLACTDPSQQNNPSHSQYCPACFLLALEAPSARGNTPPRPFVIRPPLASRAEDDRYYITGDSFKLGVNLFGYAIKLFPYVAQAIMQIGMSGVGYHRGRYTIQKIESVHPITKKRTTLMEEGITKIPSQPLTYDDVCTFLNNWVADTVELRFLTPTQINNKGKLSQRPQFALIIARLLERLEAIYYHYTKTDRLLDWSDTYQSLVSQAEAITITLDNTRWIESKGGSRRANRLQDLSGFVGDAQFTGNIKPFLPYLLWGQSLHIGKNTPKGNGWLQIRN